MPAARATIRSSAASPQQAPRVVVGEPLDADDVDARKLELARRLVADPEQQHDALGPQPARGEPERVRGLVVEPRRVVEHGEQRLLLGGVGQQGEHADADQEGVRVALVREAEGAAEGARLGLGEGVDPVLERPQELVQRSVGQLGLVLDAGRPQHGEAGRRRRRVLEQRGLADAGFAAQDERTTGTAASGVEESSEPCHLGLTTDQHGSILGQRLVIVRIR